MALTHTPRACDQCGRFRDIAYLFECDVCEARLCGDCMTFEGEDVRCPAHPVELVLTDELVTAARRVRRADVIARHAAALLGLACEELEGVDGSQVAATCAQRSLEELIGAEQRVAAARRWLALLPERLQQSA